MCPRLSDDELRSVLSETIPLGEHRNGQTLDDLCELAGPDMAVLYDPVTDGVQFAWVDDTGDLVARSLLPCWDV